MKKPSPEQGYVTAKTAAEYLHCCTGTIWNLKRTGRLPSYKLGAMVRFRIEDLDAVMKAGRIGAENVTV